MLQLRSGVKICGCGTKTVMNRNAHLWGDEVWRLIVGFLLLTVGESDGTVEFLALLRWECF
jgi:hypothetical protein